MIFLRKYKSHLLLLCLVLVVAVATMLILQNRRRMEQQVVFQQLATKIIASSHDVYEHTLTQADKSLQLFATTGTERHLLSFQKITGAKHTVFDKLRKELITQKTHVPASVAQINTLLSLQKEAETKLSAYFEACAATAVWIKQDSLEPYHELLASNQGVVAYAAWDTFNTQLLKFESDLHAQALTNHQEAMHTTMWIQIGGIVMAMTLVGWFFYHLYQRRKEHYHLIAVLDQTNRTYLFNPGVTEQTDPLGETVLNLQKASEFVRKTTEGEENVQWEGLDDTNESLNESTLVGELQRMHLRMKEVKLEDQKRNWTNEGLAYLGEILRKETDLHLLADRILSALIKYIQANQGALFVVNDDDPGHLYMDLQAAYAYNRKKHIAHTILPGEGLAGQAWQENDTIYLTDVPQNYVRITSGLGQATPTNLLIVPLNNDQHTEGVVELASFRMFEAHEIAFVEKIAESIASTLASARVNKRTSLLLQDSREMAEKLKAQDEEMRQNMEELSTTQEELQRKEREMSNVMEGIHASFAIVEFDMEGHVVAANTIFLGIVGYEQEEIRGKLHQLFVEPEEVASEEYATFWKNIRAGSICSDTYKRRTKSGDSVWLQASYVPLKDASGKPYKVLQLAKDITSEYKLRLENQERMELIEACEAEMKRALQDMMKQQMGCMEREAEAQQRIAELESMNAELMQQVNK